MNVKTHDPTMTISCRGVSNRGAADAAATSTTATNYDLQSLVGTAVVLLRLLLSMINVGCRLTSSRSRQAVCKRVVERRCKLLLIGGRNIGRPGSNYMRRRASTWASKSIGGLGRQLPLPSSSHVPPWLSSTSSPRLPFRRPPLPPPSPSPSFLCALPPCAPPSLSRIPTQPSPPKHPHPP